MIAMKLYLSDTSVRLYRKKDGKVSFRLHSYIMVDAQKGTFSLSAYMNQFDCTLQLTTGEIVDLSSIRYTATCTHSMDYMMHELWASGETEMEVMKDMVGLLRVEYRLFTYPGQGDSDLIEQHVPIITRGKHSQRYSSKPEDWS